MGRDDSYFPSAKHQMLYILPNSGLRSYQEIKDWESQKFKYEAHVSPVIEPTCHLGTQANKQIIKKNIRYVLSDS